MLGSVVDLTMVCELLHPTRDFRSRSIGKTTPGRMVNSGGDLKGEHRSDSVKSDRNIYDAFGWNGSGLDRSDQSRNPRWPTVKDQMSWTLRPGARRGPVDRRCKTACATATC